MTLGVVGGQLSPPYGMGTREDERAGITKEADAQIQAEMQSVYSLVPAISPVHYSRIS